MNSAKPSLARRAAGHFGSLRTTLAAMALLALVLAARIANDELSAGALAAALALLGLNLLAALVVDARLRRRLPLLVAHLGLLAVALLAGLGRLSSLEGRFELTEGVPYDGTLLDGRAGPWHRDTLGALGFVHRGFEIDYAPGRKRGATRNTVTWHDAAGQPRSAVIGDHRPLVLEGYRIYTSPNKGFAPLVTWIPDRGEPLVGSVHLPSFPAQELRQSREWRLPDGREVWVMLALDETLIDPAGPAAFRLPSRHKLIVRMGPARAELAPGETMALAGGTLRYEGLRTWMGYRVTRDPTLPWLLAASLLATAGLAGHALRGLFTRRTMQAPAAAPFAARGTRECADA